MSANWIIAVILISIRLGLIVLATPIPFFSYLPRHVRVLFVLAISTMLSFSLPPIPTLSGYNFMLAIVKEIFTGGVIAFAIFIAFGSLMFAGRLIETQMGLNAIGVLNPNANTGDSVLGTLITLMATMIFITSGGVELLFSGIFASFELVPIGVDRLNVGLDFFIRGFGLLFLYGLMLSAVVIFGLFLMDMVIAFIARVMPQVNIYFVSLPCKLFVGLWLLTLSLSYMSNIILQNFNANLKPLTPGVL
ncbi:MAG: flagellar biosynthetic protein FliR [Francisellaceae bacterium]